MIEGALREGLGEDGNDLFGLLRLPRRADLVAGWSPDRWRRVAELALRTQVGSLLHDRARDLPRGTLPPQVAERLARVYAWNAARNRALLAERDVVCRLLADAGVPALVLKGCHLSPLLYERIGARPMSDVDVLVHREDLGRAQSIMVLGGYGPATVNIEAAIRAGHHLRPIRRPGGFPIEVHWTLGEAVDTGSPRPETLGVWERSVALGVAGARAMDPVDATIYTCRHLAVHHAFGSTNGISGLADVAALLQSGLVGESELVDRARAWCLTRAVHLTLRVARALLGAPVTDEALCALHSDPVPWGQVG